MDRVLGKAAVFTVDTFKNIKTHFSAPSRVRVDSTGVATAARACLDAGSPLGCQLERRALQPPIVAVVIPSVAINLDKLLAGIDELEVVEQSAVDRRTPPVMWMRWSTARLSVRSAIVTSSAMMNTISFVRYSPSMITLSRSPEAERIVTSGTAKIIRRSDSPPVIV